MLAASVLLMVAFARREHRARHPLVDWALFRDRRFTWGTVASVDVSVALYAILFILPQYLQSALGDDPLTAGLRLLPLMAGLLVAGVGAGPVTRAVGRKLAVAAGLALLAGGLAVLSQVHLSTGYVVMAAGLALCGLGIGASMTAAMDGVMAAAGGDEAGAGASVNSTLRQIGGALAVAVLGGVLSASYAGALRPALAGLPAAQAAAARGSVAQAAQLASHLPAGGALLHAAGTAFVDGMGVVMLICVALTALTAAITLRFLPGRSRRPSAQQAERAA
jgi:Na+/melibiose symporter-like transporter